MIRVEVDEGSTVRRRGVTVRTLSLQGRTQMPFVAMADKRETVPTLIAYETMMHKCWPAVHGDLRKRKSAWPGLDDRTLRGELAALLAVTDTSPVARRIFWKLVPGFTFRGGNTLFAKDAGHASVESLMGLTDFSKEVPWNRQAPLYRKDDEEVVATKTAKLDIVQRQDQGKETIYLHAAKVPIVATSGEVLGLMGAYTQIDAATARALTNKSPG